MFIRPVTGWCSHVDLRHQLTPEITLQTYVDQPIAPPPRLIPQPLPLPSPYGTGTGVHAVQALCLASNLLGTLGYSLWSALQYVPHLFLRLLT